MRNRDSSIVISNVYIFIALLFVAPADLTRSTTIPTTGTGPPQSPALAEVLNGMGGPKEGSLPLSLNVETTNWETTQKEDGPRVTTTQTVNHLKVADTGWPVDDPIVSSSYGWRVAPCDACSTDHRGVDFTPGRGKPVLSVADGMVIEMGTSGGYGNYVALRHLMGNSEGGIDEWTTLYAHMENNSFPDNLKIGSVVTTGDTLGRVGNTGVSTGPHLHFELRINGLHVDPTPYLGTYKVLTVIEEDHPDYMFLGETFKTTTEHITYK